MERISENALEVAVKDGNHWIVPKGTEYQLLSNRHRQKGTNATGTMDYVSWAIVNKGDNAEYHTAAVLGNNGKLTIAPATGIKVTKTVTETVENADNVFTFVISGGTGSAKLVRPGANENGTDKIETLTFADGKASFTISAGETVYITGLEAGKAYTVTEAGNDDYAVQSITVNGKAQNAAVITLEQGQMQSVAFVNAPKGYGDLFITKIVNAEDGHTVPDSVLNREFDLTVTLEGLENQEFQVIHSANENLTQVTTDDEGKFTVALKHGETFEILGVADVDFHELPPNSVFLRPDFLKIPKMSVEEIFRLPLDAIIIDCDEDLQTKYALMAAEHKLHIQFEKVF
jgi:hypothetical protein